MNSKKLIYKNCEPSEVADYFRDETLTRIMELCPCESNAETTLEKIQDEYLVKTTIFFLGGSHEMFTRGPHLESVLTKNADGLYKQVREWRKHRFDHDTSHLNWKEEAKRPEGVKSIQETLSYLAALSPKEDGHINLKILIVDDDLESVTPLALCLQKLGCLTKVVTSGYEAIDEMVRKDTSYDAIILDWVMPKLNGEQTISYAQSVLTSFPSLNQHWRTEQMPVILYSGRPSNEIGLPKCENFQLIDQWEKTSSYPELLAKATKTLGQLNE